jgi:hypothetical protein
MRVKGPCCVAYVKIAGVRMSRISWRVGSGVASTRAHTDKKAAKESLSIVRYTHNRYAQLPI